MELRQLQYFVAAARHLNFTKAARECCIVQSAMSQQITALEKEMGVRFFERTNHGLALTPEGEVMAREARRLLDQAEIVQEIVRESSNRYVSVLRIGCHGNLLRTALPKALAAFRARHPHTRALISSDIQSRLLGELREGQIDCLLMLRPEAGGMDWAEIQPVCEEPVYAALPVGHPLARQDALHRADLSGEPLIDFTDDDRRSVGFRRRNAQIYARTPSQNCVEALTAAGYGFSYCVRSAIREHPGLIFREITDIAPAQTCLVWRSGSPLEALMRELLSLLVMASAE